MDTLAVITRQRAVMTTIADMIVAAAAGRSLRVAIGCTHHDEIGFADQLTQALYARGRPSRCLPPSDVAAAAATGSAPLCSPDSPLVAVILSCGPSPEESGLCRIDIQLRRQVPAAASGPASPSLESEPGGCGAAEDGRRADIVVEYLPEGPTIRHLASHLKPDPA